MCGADDDLDGFSEYYYLKEVFLSIGFPPIEDSAYPPCGVIALNKACSKKGQTAFITNAVQLARNVKLIHP